MGAFLRSLPFSEDALLKDSSVITGEISKRPLQQWALPTNLTAAADWIIHCSGVFLRHQPCKYTQRWTITLFQLALPGSSCVHRELPSNIWTVSPPGLRLPLWAYTNTTNAQMHYQSFAFELQGEIRCVCVGKISAFLWVLSQDGFSLFDLHFQPQ